MHLSLVIAAEVIAGYWNEKSNVDTVATPCWLTFLRPAASASLRLAVLWGGWWRRRGLLSLTWVKPKLRLFIVRSVWTEKKTAAVAAQITGFQKDSVVRLASMLGACYASVACFPWKTVQTLLMVLRDPLFLWDLGKTNSKWGLILINWLITIYSLQNGWFLSLMAFSFREGSLLVLYMSITLGTAQIGFGKRKYTCGGRK